MMTQLSLLPCGEGAVRFISDQPSAEKRWRTVHRIANWLDEHPITGVHGSVATYDSLLIEFDPVLVNADLLHNVIATAQQVENFSISGSQRFTIPVVYGGAQGPDLEFVADFLDITTADVIELHSANDHVVRCLGGPAASCMIDSPPFTSPIPRLKDPRIEVPANAISLAGTQGVIGPVKAPSGWRLIGLTPIAIMDLRSDSLVPYRPGDLIRFYPITEREWDNYHGHYLHEIAEPC